MSLFALGLVLISAVFHATWNLLAKRVGADTPFLFLAYVVGAIVFAPFAIAILVIARPELGWPALVFVLVAVCLQTLYFATLTAGYGVGAPPMGGHRRGRPQPARVHPRAHGARGESGLVCRAGARDRHPDRRDPRRARAR